MKSYLAVGFTTSVLTATAVALADVATGAPTGPSRVDEVVRTLEASGYTVILNRTGAASLRECTVSAVRPGPTHTTTDVRGSDIEPMIISDTVYVDLMC